VGPPEQEEEWHYAVGDQQAGPVTRRKLQQLISTGQISGDTEVWAVGMADWQPAHTIDGLVPASVAVGQSPRANVQPGSAAASDSNVLLIRSLKSMRVWTLTVALVGSVLTIIQLIRGIILIVADNGPIGLAMILVAAVQGTAFIFLLIFSGRAGKYLEEREEFQLVAALDMMRIFWIYIGVFFWILLGLLIIGISLFLAGVDMLAVDSF
jgi:hypothetical protein